MDSLQNINLSRIARNKKECVLKLQNLSKWLEQPYYRSLDLGTINES